MSIIGKPAPSYEGQAFVGGEIKNIAPADFKDKWVVLTFYPLDFTAV